MENRLKERLTGAAILVALIVALVPELFRGQAGAPAGSASAPAASTTGSSSGDGAPVRTYTIDLSNPGTAPLQSASEPEPTRTPAANGAAPAAGMPALPPPVTPAVSAAMPSPPAPPTPAPTHVARAPPAAATIAAAPSAAPKAAPAAGWSVQLGLFSKRENAERMVNEARSKGFSAGIAGPDAKGQFHVHVTGLTDRSAAQAMAQKLKGEGLPAAVVAP